MSVAAPLLRAANSADFAAASRMLFGPITQKFTGGALASNPSLFSVRLGVCRLSEIHAGAHLVRNERSFWRSFDPDSIKILLQLRGRSRFEQQAATIVLHPRSAIVYDPVRSYSLQNFSDVSQLVLQAPRSTFDDETLARLAAPIPLPEEDDGLARIVAALMQTAIKEAPRLDDASCRRVGDSLIQLVTGLIHAEPSAPEFRRSPLEALRERAIEYIDANLARTDISAEHIARRMGCSCRYLHRAFEGEGTTLSRFIWSRRLQRSREAILRASKTPVSITEIAFACGFSSSAHFSRAFKSQYDVAPRELRQQAAAAIRR